MESYASVYFITKLQIFATGTTHTTWNLGKLSLNTNAILLMCLLTEDNFNYTVCTIILHFSHISAHTLSPWHNRQVSEVYFTCWPPTVVVAAMPSINSGKLAHCSPSLFLLYRAPGIIWLHSHSVTLHENTFAIMVKGLAPWGPLPKRCDMLKKVSGSASFAVWHNVAGSQTFKSAFLVAYLVMWTLLNLSDQKIIGTSKYVPSSGICICYSCFNSNVNRADVCVNAAVSLRSLGRKVIAELQCNYNLKF